ncbi:MAG TPA: hypothetical protein VFT75_11430 [Nocardioidaceae bacterium]|jgi:hypothetical protein|nr:hypothetical protein [Nocardioidaceae bacterium]
MAGSLRRCHHPALRPGRRNSVFFASGNIWLTYVRKDASPWVVYTFSLGPLQFSAYAGLIALAVNILVLLVAQPVCQALRLPAGTDETVSDDYEAEPEPARVREPARAG